MTGNCWGGLLNTHIRHPHKQEISKVGFTQRFCPVCFLSAAARLKQLGAATAPRVAVVWDIFNLLCVCVCVSTGDDPHGTLAPLGPRFATGAPRSNLEVATAEDQVAPHARIDVPLQWIREALTAAGSIWRPAAHDCCCFCCELPDFHLRRSSAARDAGPASLFWARRPQACHCGLCQCGTLPWSGGSGRPHGRPCAGACCTPPACCLRLALGDGHRH
jgi:hypothetical protein